MSETYDSHRVQALEALIAQEPRKAFGIFRGALRYPGAPELKDRVRWTEAWEVFARIAAAISSEELAAIVRKAAQDPDDVQALYDLGFQLIEQSLHDLAATVLARAHACLPGHVGILEELSSALEGMDAHSEAARFLQAAPELVQEHAMLRYLYAFNSIMSGDLDTPRQLLPRLAVLCTPTEETPPDKAQLFETLVGRIREFLARADAVRAVSPLDDQDLRGWQFVITGSVLLRLSPYGFDEGMNGRYAYLQDSEHSCLEGIRCVEAVLAHTDRRPPRVFILPDRDSAILGHATARVLGLPAEPWPEHGSDAPGLVVAYDLSMLEPELTAQFRRHRPGQLLWSHAVPWTESPPFSPDLTTLLYQMNTSPWGARLRVVPDTQQTEKAAPEEGSVESLAARLASMKLEAEALKDLPELLRLLGAMASVQGAAVGGLFRESGLRRRHFSDSPVKSSRFL
ncbi:tetratricopeptide repeat protein [Pyxidicoccus xibeiensis]|uniref:hypothetical protein n=1 Tax=Pyxidicoccus xibeiensis TaxID=2906759 RepID=UPI0020A7BD41|nr:hypothetical protein [Pyxidicoccus xibeiensis]MCP3140846.1 hypothetical protein [Pyxidicoccus xibeiensis]